MSRYSKHLSAKKTPQTEPIPGKNMVKNNAGGYVFSVDDQTLLKRFLILGSDNGSYYASEKKLTIDNAKNVIKCIENNGPSTVNLITEISTNGQAPKNDPAIFALALACTYGDSVTKALAYDSIYKVCRTGTHLFSFCQAIQDMRGWSRGLCTGVSNFYTSKSLDELALQLVKYRQRNGWTHKDVLRLAHPKAVSNEMSDMFKWAVGKWSEEENDGSHAPHSMLSAFVELPTFSKAKTQIEIIKQNKLPWEAIPTELLNNPEVWEAMLPTMGLTALIRNLGKMTSIGVLKNNLDKNTKLVKKKLLNKEFIKKSRVHPMTVLIASKVYAQGHGDKGKLHWTPLQSIIDSLDEAFYLAFDNVTPTGKNLLVAVDCSGSMTSGQVAGSSLSPREAAAAMALVIAHTEPNFEVIAFDTRVARLPISPKMRLNELLREMSKLGFGGGTDCSLPMQYAISEHIDVDAFVLLTDNETWAGGRVHPVQVLDNYRKLSHKNSKIVNVGMVANNYSVCDDKNSLHVVGFDTAVPVLINQFIGE